MLGAMGAAAPVGFPEQQAALAAAAEEGRAGTGAEGGGGGAAGGGKEGVAVAAALERVASVELRQATMRRAESGVPVCTVGRRPGARACLRGLDGAA